MEALGKVSLENSRFLNLLFQRCESLQPRLATSWAHSEDLPLHQFRQDLPLHQFCPDLPLHQFGQDLPLHQFGPDLPLHQFSPDLPLHQFGPDLPLQWFGQGLPLHQNGPSATRDIKNRDIAQPEARFHVCFYKWVFLDFQGPSQPALKTVPAPFFPGGYTRSDRVCLN